MSNTLKAMFINGSPRKNWILPSSESHQAGLNGRVVRKVRESRGREQRPQRLPHLSARQDDTHGNDIHHELSGGLHA